MEQTYIVKLNYEQYCVLKEILKRFDTAIEEDKKWQEKCDEMEREIDRELEN